MNGAFNGFGIPQDLKTEDSTIKNDPYLLKLREILSQENIMNEYTQERTSNLQQELLYPYLNFFLRNDKNNPDAPPTSNNFPFENDEAF